ncbi:hypothetical protein Nepgr_028393 [Nepenthes gracilis]|uniref:Uncharacterized protein n=1 Tax=Nepenthes gracilis TaxID=150966 RepID=A0AAD3Y3X0_NEPGR|nr:hypothetical protein Nepgr_028393 [Nepenthes gracilis]
MLQYTVVFFWVHEHGIRAITVSQCSSTLEFRKISGIGTRTTPTFFLELQNSLSVLCESSLLLRRPYLEGEADIEDKLRWQNLCFESKKKQSSKHWTNLPVLDR